jgi:hypothetical protein
MTMAVAAHGIFTGVLSTPKAVRALRLPILDILVHDTEVVRLTRQRMEKLKEAQADKSRNEAE